MTTQTEINYQKLLNISEEIDEIIKQYKEANNLKHRCKQQKKTIDNFELSYVDIFSYTHPDEHFGEADEYEEAKERLEGMKSSLEYLVKRKAESEKYFKLLCHQFRERHGENEKQYLEKVIEDLRCKRI